MLSLQESESFKHVVFASPLVCFAMDNPFRFNVEDHEKRMEYDSYDDIVAMDYEREQDGYYDDVADLLNQIGEYMRLNLSKSPSLWSAAGNYLDNSSTSPPASSQHLETWAASYSIPPVPQTVFNPGADIRNHTREWQQSDFNCRNDDTLSRYDYEESPFVEHGTSPAALDGVVNIRHNTRVPKKRFALGLRMRNTIIHSASRLVQTTFMQVGMTAAHTHRSKTCAILVTIREPDCSRYPNFVCYHLHGVGYRITASDM